MFIHRHFDSIIKREIGLYQEAIAVNPWQFEERDDAWKAVANNTTKALGLTGPPHLTPRLAWEKIKKQVYYYRQQNRKNIQK